MHKILAHPQYRQHLKSIAEYEKNREFCRHDLEHFESVGDIAFILSVKDGKPQNQELLKACGLLHDIARYVEYEDGTPHEIKSAEFALVILEELGFSENEKEIIANAIREHRADSINCTSDFSRYINLADDLSRNCVNCEAIDKCKRPKNIAVGRD